MRVRLPDGSERELPEGATAADLAAAIGPRLARNAVAAKINGRLVDLTTPLADGDEVAIVTADSPEGLEVLRHSTAHLLAMAVKDLYPQAQVTIGPVIEDGFYYDFAVPKPFTDEDLQKIEEKMREIARRKLPVRREVWSREEAIRYFREQGEHYKVRLIERIPEDEEITLYEQGGWRDLCRGPHVPNTKILKHFKLMKVAGAYWEGDAANEQLQRIYGTAWATKAQLEDYLKRLREAEARDHRRLGRELDLFHFQEEAPGMVFWHPKGWTIFRVIEEEIRNLMRAHGYEEVRTPQIVDRSLWERSGHWDKFREQMFTTGSEERIFAIKPMNCPCHIQIYNRRLRSYRELPVRLAEFGSCHRNEPSGTLHGLMRLRNFTQDDAHIFCTEEQIQEEVARFMDLLFLVYRRFGFEDVRIYLSDRPEQRVGDDALWDRAEAALHEALKARGVDYEVNPGEGAFYGPKIEFSLRDCLGRVWQCGTIQVDFWMPGRLGAEYVDKDGARKTPVMLHRAILGSIERFIGILIEHHEGKLPFWLAPVQAVVCNITDAQADWAREAAEKMRQAGFRVEADLRNEKVGYKVRAHTLARTPFILVVGDREKQRRGVRVRSLAGADLGEFSLEAWIEEMRRLRAEYR